MDRRNLKVKEKLRIGLVEDDGVYTPSPPVRRVMKETSDLLRKSTEIDIISLTLPNVQEHYQDLISYFTLLGPKVREQHSIVSLRTLIRTA